MPIAKTGNPFRLRIRSSHALAEPETGWILQDHSYVVLISIGVNSNGKLYRAFADRNLAPSLGRDRNQKLANRAYSEGAVAR